MAEESTRNLRLLDRSVLWGFRWCSDLLPKNLDLKFSREQKPWIFLLSFFFISSYFFLSFFLSLSRDPFDGKISLKVIALLIILLDVKCIFNYTFCNESLQDFMDLYWKIRRCHRILNVVIFLILLTSIWCFKRNKIKQSEIDRYFKAEMSKQY